APTKSFLANALSAVAAGKPCDPRETEAPGCVLTLPESAPARVTFAKDVLPILQRRCQQCHRPGEVGPFALTSYAEAKGHAKMIANVLERGGMPPWNADAKFDGVFANERKLPAREKETLLAWIGAGMPEGDAADAPAPVKWPEGWSIGTPDVVLSPDY